MNLSKAHAELDRLFDIFNEKKFENKLEKPITIIQSTGKKPINGYCTLNKVWKSATDENNECYEICISAENLARDIYGICGTLLHEMTHLMNVSLGIKDTAPNYVYHNKKFKASAEAVGLIIEKAPTIGWSVTTLSDDLKRFVDGLNVDTEAFSFFRTRPIKIKKENKYKQYKYVCPSCEEAIYSRNQNLHISCDSCSEDFLVFFEIQIKE